MFRLAITAIVAALSILSAAQAEDRWIISEQTDGNGVQTLFVIGQHGRTMRSFETQTAIAETAGSVAFFCSKGASGFLYHIDSHMFPEKLVPVMLRTVRKGQEGLVEIAQFFAEAEAFPNGRPGNQISVGDAATTLSMISAIEDNGGLMIRTFDMIAGDVTAIFDDQGLERSAVESLRTCLQKLTEG